MGHRLAHDHAAADDHGIRARRFNAGRLQQPHAAQRGAGHKTGFILQHQLGDVLRVEAVHILGGVYFQDHGRLVDMGGRRALHQNAVDGGVRIQVTDDLEQFFLGGIRGENDFTGVHSQLRAFFHFGIHIHLGGGVLPHQNHGQAGRYSLFPEPGNVLSNLFQHLGGYLFSVDDLHNND